MQGAALGTMPYRHPSEYRAPSCKDNCYYTGGDSPWIDYYRGHCLFRDGGALQVEPFKDVHDPIYRRYHSPQNIEYLQSILTRQGFQAPHPDHLRDFMDGVWTDDMPYGAWNRLELTRDHRSGNYTKYWVDRLNQQTINRVSRNMSVMREANRIYMKDIRSHGIRGAMEIDRPINVSCKYAGDQLRLDFLLPDPYPGN